MYHSVDESPPVSISSSTSRGLRLQASFRDLKEDTVLSWEDITVTEGLRRGAQGVQGEAEGFWGGCAG